jgi:hypothetical protein
MNFSEFSLPCSPSNQLFVTMEDAVYELRDQRSPLKRAMPYGVAAGVLVLVGFFLPGLLAWTLFALGVVAGGVFVANYLNVNPQAVILLADRVVLKTKAGEKMVMLGEITKAELTYTEGGAMKKIGFFGADSFQADEKAMLTITDSSNQRLEVLAQDYALADFRSFLEVFQVNGNSGRLIDEQKFDDLIKQNEEYLKQDRKLKADLQQNLLEGYKAIYQLRGEFHRKQHPEAVVVYKHQPNPNDGATYFLEGDYLEGLDEGSVQAGLNLLTGSQKNLAVVETRMDYYQKIAAKLQVMKEAQKARARVSKVAGKLETLQKQNETGTGQQDELGLQTETLEQLKMLSQDLRGMDDLGTANLLKQVDEVLAK